MSQEHITVPVERINNDSLYGEDDEFFEHEVDSKHYAAFIVLTDKGIVIELSPKDEDELEHHGLCTMHVSLERIVSSCGELRRHEYFTTLGKQTTKNPLGLESAEEVEE